MKLYHSYKGQIYNSKQIVLENEYIERYCSYKQTGVDSVIDFVIHIKQTKYPDNNIFYNECPLIYLIL